MNDWKLPCPGGCRCGETRLRVSAPPLLASACQCTVSRQVSARGGSVSVAVPSIGLAVTDGAPVVGGLHGAKRHAFRRSCTSWMFRHAEGMDELMNGRTCMLDEHAGSFPFRRVPEAGGLAFGMYAGATQFCY